MFADNTKSFREITDVADMNMLQNYLMEKWSKTWLLQFHPGKCVVMSVGLWWNIIQAYPNKLMSTGLERVLEEKDIGIIIDSEQTFESHIEAKLGTANQMFGHIRRSFTCCTAEIVIPVYKAFVRQHLQGCTFYSTARHCRVSSPSDYYLSNLLVPVSSMFLRIELLNNQ